MVTKNTSKKQAASSENESRITRVKAIDTKVTKVKTDKASKKQRTTPKFFVPFVRLGGYFKGAWKELREVRWPSRRATWGLTLAVILFSLLLTAVILSLDALFKLLFEVIIK